MSKEKESVLTQEQIEYLWNKMNMKFGAELESLHNMLTKDIKTVGYVTKKTIQTKEKLMKRILEEKHKNDLQS